MYPNLILAINFLFLVLSVTSSLVARHEARSARAVNRANGVAIHELQLEMDRFRAGLRRIEGRQTARMGKTSGTTANGLPDPLLDPEGWRAAVRRLNVKPTSPGELQ